MSLKGLFFLGVGVVGDILVVFGGENFWFGLIGLCMMMGVIGYSTANL